MRYPASHLLCSLRTTSQSVRHYKQSYVTGTDCFTSSYLSGVTHSFLETFSIGSLVAAQQVICDSALQVHVYASFSLDIFFAVP